MTSRERVLTALRHQPTDHSPFFLGAPTREVLDRLSAHFNVSNNEALLTAIGDDFRWTKHFSWNGPEPNNVFAIPRADVLDCQTVADVDRLPWPDPALVDVSGIREHCLSVPGYSIMGGSWAPFFHQMGDVFGQEEYFIRMHTEPDVIEAATDHMVKFHLAANEKVFRAAGDLMDFFFFGNDLGTQRGPFISPECFRRFVLPGFKRLADQARSFGLHPWLHCCGSVYEFIPDLIDIGIEALHPMQISAANMSPEKLAKDFKGKIMFVGGIDVHQLLRTGTTEEVREAVRRNRRALGPGYVVSPSHEAILPDVKDENLLAMVDEAKRG